MGTDRLERLIADMPKFGELQFAPLGPPSTAEVRRHLAGLKTFLIQTGKYIESRGGNLGIVVLSVTIHKETHEWEIHVPNFSFSRENLNDPTIEVIWHAIRHHGYYRIKQTEVDITFSIELLRREFDHRRASIQRENATHKHPYFEGLSTASTSKVTHVSNWESVKTNR